MITEIQEDNRIQQLGQHLSLEGRSLKQGSSLQETKRYSNTEKKRSGFLERHEEDQEDIVYQDDLDHEGDGEDHGELDREEDEEGHEELEDVGDEEDQGDCEGQEGPDDQGDHEDHVDLVDHVDQGDHEDQVDHGEKEGRKDHVIFD